MNRLDTFRGTEATAVSTCAPVPADRGLLAPGRGDPWICAQRERRHQTGATHRVSDPLSVSNARSLGGLPLADLGNAAGVERMRLDLDPVGTRVLLGSLRAQADTASARLAAATQHHLERSEHGWCAERPRDVAVAVHRVLTRSRFLKGSRSCFPPDLAIAKIGPFVEQRRPVTLMLSGFPFKQHDNGLKAAGPHPDLAELGALVRLRELHRAVAALYPPGLHVVVLADGGYSRPRPWSEVFRYRARVQRFAEHAGVAGIVTLCDRNRYVADLLGERGWGERERGLRQVRDLVETLAGPPRSLAESAGADVRMSRALPPQLLAGVPAFRDIVSSLVYSVPVPAPHGSECARAEPMRWACQVLAEPDRVDTAGLPGELVRARRAVLASAWRHAVDHLAAAVADNAVGVPERFPLHVRLATGAPRPGCSGFSYLGGSTLLPWHGTGCLDGRGRVCADFLVSLHDRGFLPVHCEYLAGGEPGDSGDQPLLMVPFARTVFVGGRRRVDPELLASVRLRSR